MKILISDAFDPSLPDKLQRFGEVTDDKEQLDSCDVVLIRSKTKCTREYIDNAPNLKLIIRGGVGLDNVDREYAQSKGIAVFNTAAASSVAVAELAFAHLIALPNHIVAGHNSLNEGRWIKKELKRTELMGKTLGIIGCGRIGQELAMRAKAFGMEVIGYDIIPIESEYMTVYNDIDQVLPRCDYLSLNIPLTEQTKGMVNSELIARMKDGVYISNTGRGKAVVEADVVAALESGKIKGYATDVWYSDPPENSPLIGAANTLLAPHLGASTVENLLRIGEIVEELIGQFEAGTL